MGITNVVAVATDKVGVNLLDDVIDIDAIIDWDLLIYAPDGVSAAGSATADKISDTPLASSNKISATGSAPVDKINA